MALISVTWVSPRGQAALPAPWGLGGREGVTRQVLDVEINRSVVLRNTAEAGRLEEPSISFQTSNEAQPRATARRRESGYRPVFSEKRVYFFPGRELDLE